MRLIYLRLLFVCLFSIIFAHAVQASEMKGAITVTEGSTQRTYHIKAQYQAGLGTRVLLSSDDDEVIDVTLSGESIPDSFFAKIILMGVMDPFFAMEMIWGSGEAIYRPYMQEDGDTLVFQIKPEDAMVMYELFSAQAMLSKTGAEVLRQLVIALEPEISYKFETQGDTIKISLKSKTSAPDIRYASGVMEINPTPIQHQAQLPSYE